MFTSAWTTALTCSEPCRRERLRRYHAERWLRVRPDPAEWVTTRCVTCRREFQTRTGATICSKPCERAREANLARGTYSRRRGCERLRIGKRDLRRVLERYRHSCAYCQTQLRRGGRRSDSLEWDHVIPIARGGRHGVGNLVPACMKCNRQKNDRLLVEWRMQKAQKILSQNPSVAL